MLLLQLAVFGQYSVTHFDIAPFVGFRLQF